MLDRKRVELGVADQLTEITGLKPAVLVALGEQGVKSLDDLADLAGDELLEIAPNGTLTEDRANEIIMAARAHWFEGEETPETELSEPEATKVDTQEGVKEG